MSTVKRMPLSMEPAVGVQRTLGLVIRLWYLATNISTIFTTSQAAVEEDTMVTHCNTCHLPMMVHRVGDRRIRHIKDMGKATPMLATGLYTTVLLDPPAPNGLQITPV